MTTYGWIEELNGPRPDWHGQPRDWKWEVLFTNAERGLSAVAACCECAPSVYEKRNRLETTTEV